MTSQMNTMIFVDIVIIQIFLVAWMVMDVLKIVMCAIKYMIVMTSQMKGDIYVWNGIAQLETPNALCLNINAIQKTSTVFST